MLVSEHDNSVVLSWTRPTPGHLRLSARGAAEMGRTLFRCCFILQHYPDPLPIQLAGHAPPGQLPDRHLSHYEALDLAGALFGSACNVLARACPEPPVVPPAPPVEDGTAQEVEPDLWVDVGGEGRR